jgi:histidinol-phosphate aminotransferase
MKFWNKILRELSEYQPGEQPGKINEYIKLNTNENPFAPTEMVIESIKKNVNGNLRLYPDPYADELRDKFALQNDILRENVFISNGSDEIFTLIFRAFIENKKVAAFPYPSYSLYDTLAQANGVKYEKINLNKNFNYNLNAFLEKDYSLVIIANPNNPTGTFISKEKIEVFLKAYKGLLVVDEAYIDFYGGSSIELIKKYDNLIVTRSFSKSYSLAGLRIGIAIAHKDLIRGFMKIKDSYNIDRIAIIAAVAALDDKKGYKYNNQMLLNNKEYMEEMLNILDFEIVPSRGNFVFAKHKRINSLELYESLKKMNILVRYFKDQVSSNYIRISVGTMQEIKKLIKALESIIGE